MKINIIGTAITIVKRECTPYVKDQRDLRIRSEDFSEEMDETETSVN